jgi:hypothetical protein
VDLEGSAQGLRGRRGLVVEVGMLTWSKANICTRFDAHRRHGAMACTLPPLDCYMIGWNTRPSLWAGRLSDRNALESHERDKARARLVGLAQVEV